MRPARLRLPQPCDAVLLTGQLAVVGGTAAAVWWGALAQSPPADGLASRRFGGVILAIGALCAGLLVTAALRARGQVRLSWAVVVVAEAVWVSALYGSVAGWPTMLAWGFLRMVGYVAVGVGLLLAPGVRRGRYDWVLLLLDGWLVAASSVEITWVAVRIHGTTLAGIAARPTPALLWTCWDLASATVITGLTLRVRYQRRSPVVLVGFAAIVAMVADLTWAQTRDLRIGAGLMLVMLACLGASTLTPRLDIWSGAAPDPDQPRLGRPSHVAAVPGLLAAVISTRPDALVIGLAVSLLTVLVAEIMMTSAVTRALWTRLREQTDRLDAVLRDSRDAIVVVRLDGIVEYANPASAEVLGREAGTLVGTRLAEHVHPDDLAPLRGVIWRLRVDGEPVRVLGRFRRPGGAWRHVESTVSLRVGGGRPGIIVLARDVEDRVRLEAELRNQAETDALTGLLNRQAFLTALESHLSVGPMAVLFCDLDGFKAVNDTEGHAVGDTLLRRAAQTIAQTVRPGQLVARLGGDEFAVLVPPGEDSITALIAVERAAEDVAEALVDRLARARRDGRVGVSIGVAISAGPLSGHPDHAQELLRDADLAMYEAKGAGGGSWVRFETAMRDRVLTRSQLRADLERAIADGGLTIDLQPIVDVGTGVWTQFEALVRWQHGERRRSPGEFLPLAEETGLMVPLGAWVLRAALAWLATWPDDQAGISVNVTGGQVAEPGFVDMVRSELDRRALAPGRLTLEITEQTAVEDLGRAGAVLQPLRALGVHVALDDFGTGFCSLGYLAQLPVDELKIDRQFVDGLGRRAEDDALVRAVLGLAGDLGLRVVAEGVETGEQAEILRGYGCPLMQGYLYSRPVPADLLVPGGRRRSSSVPCQPGPLSHGPLSASPREASPPQRV